MGTTPIVCILNVYFISMICCIPKLYLFLLGFVPLIAARSGVMHATTGSVVFQLPASMEAEILNYVNEDREQHGLASLKMNDVESAFGHTGLNARAKAIRKALGVISSIGENVASGPMNAREVVDGWLNSPGHKRNIEGDFTLTGIGYARDKKGNIYFTQIFSR